MESRAVPPYLVTVAIISGLTGERRPVSALMKYYALLSLLAGPGLIILLPYRFLSSLGVICSLHKC